VSPVGTIDMENTDGKLPIQYDERYSAVPTGLAAEGYDRSRH